MKRDELRKGLLGAGLDMILEEGLSSGADRLTFKRVFDRFFEDTGIRVTNSSVIGRIWDNNEDFQNEVLAALVSDQNDSEIEATLEEAARVFVEADLTTRAGRRFALSELCRRAGAVHADAISGSRTWHVFIGTWGSMSSRPESEWDPRVADAARSTYEATTVRFEEIFDGVAQVIGLRLRKGMTLRDFTIAVTSLSEGCALRSQLDWASTHGIQLPDSEGNLREWTLFGIGLEALVWHFWALR